MKRYYALDYINEHECELVYDGQLYLTEEEAEAARQRMPRPELFDVTWYLIKDLEDDVFGYPITIDENLRVK